MIEITETRVTGFEAAIRGMRNPLESWEKSDSHVCGVLEQQEAECGMVDNHHVQAAKDCREAYKCGFCIGENDFSLMRKLVKSGTDHSKFMRYIIVTADCLAPRYWWSEYDTYKVGTVANSCSTMHKIHARDVLLSDFSHEHLDDNGLMLLDDLIIGINEARRLYLSTGNKDWWWQMIQLLPSSYNQKRTILLNYQVLRTMYHARKNHKLDEWHRFCDWIESLPYSELITGKEIDLWIPVSDYLPCSVGEVRIRYKAKDGQIKETIGEISTDTFGKRYVTGGIGFNHVIAWAEIRDEKS